MGPPLQAGPAERILTEDAGELISEQDESEVVGQQESGEAVEILGRFHEAGVDEMGEHLLAQGEPAAEQIAGTSCEQHPAQICRKRRVRRNGLREGLAERGGSLGSQRVAGLTVERCQHGVEDSGGVVIDRRAETVLAPEVVDDERRRHSRLSGNLPQCHRVRASLGEQPQGGIADHRS